MQIEGDQTHCQIFLQGIGAPECWSDRGQYSIFELGFGTGLNFLDTAQVWLDTNNIGRLDYFAVEGSPLNANQIESVLPAQLAQSALARELLEALPLRHPGFHRLELAQGRIGLTLIYQQAAEALANVSGRFDAFYLDGFSPELSPDMWTPEMFQGLAAIGRGGARLVSASPDDFIRARLQQAGFRTWADPKASECLSAELVKPADRARINQSVSRVGGRVAIIGAGVAGSFLTHALEQRGLSATLIDRHPTPFAEASGNPVALINPKLTLGSDPYARFNLAAFLDCVRAYKVLSKEALNIWMEPRGVYVSPDPGAPPDRFDKLVTRLGWPGDLLKIEASGETGGTERLLVGDGGAVKPANIARALSKERQLVRAKVASIERNDGSWRVWAETGALVSESEILVLANGLGARALLKDWCPPLEGRHGVIALLKAAETVFPQPTEAFGLYLSPAFETNNGVWVQALGASFDHMADEHASNIDAQARATALWQQFRAEQPELAAAYDEPPVGFRGGVRVVTPDQMPVAGPVVTPAGEPPLDRKRGQVPHPLAYTQDETVSGLFMLTGLGSRGFQSAPLLAALVAAQISGTPLPLPADIMSHLVPARFLARKARGKGVK